MTVQKLQNKMKRTLSRVYKHAFEIWERAHQDLKELMKKYPAVKNTFFEKQLDIAGTKAQINLMKYELTDVVPKRATHKSPNHTGSRRDIFFMIFALIFIIALICFATVATINLFFFLMEVWY
ncbi:MAG: hypothetical protein R6U96_14610 [Promethearchaeia archaeon]